MARHRDFTGVRERGMRARGMPRNLGGPVVSAQKSRSGNRVTKPKTQAGGLPSPGSDQRAHARYGQAKETKCGRRGGRESEHRVVPVKRGNSPRGPRGGKAVPDCGSVGGNDGRDIGLGSHLNATPTGSGAGEGDAASGAHDAGPSQRPRPAPRSVSSHAQGWCRRRRRTDRSGVRGEARRESA